MPINTDDIIGAPEFGACCYKRDGFNALGLTVILLGFLASAITISPWSLLYLAMKAYKVHEQIEKETRLAGRNSQPDKLKALEKKQRNIRHYRKPIITSFVVISGNAFIVFFFFHCIFWKGLHQLTSIQRAHELRKFQTLLFRCFPWEFLYFCQSIFD